MLVVEPNTRPKTNNTKAYGYIYSRPNLIIGLALGAFNSF
jgi:hypothetical protein